MLCNLVIELNTQGLHDYWSSRTCLSYFLSILTTVSGRLTSYYLMSCFPGRYIGVNFLVIYFSTLSLSKLRCIDRCYLIIDNTLIFSWIYWILKGSIWDSHLNPYFYEHLHWLLRQFQCTLCFLPCKWRVECGKRLWSGRRRERSVSTVGLLGFCFLTRNFFSLCIGNSTPLSRLPEI
jgi:hypothetical protein